MKTTVNYLIEELSKFKDAYSVEFRKALKEPDYLNAVHRIEVEPQRGLFAKYDVSVRMAISEILYP